MTTQEQADQLAEIGSLVVAGWCLSEDDYESFIQDQVDRLGAKEKLKQAIPLLELLEVAKATRDLNELMHMSSRPYWDRQELYEQMKKVEATLQALREKGVEI